MSEPVGAPDELLRALAVAVEPPGPEHASIFDALGMVPAPDGADYADLFAFQLYPYASVHVGAEGMMGGEARGRVAGFWSALGLTPPAEPDHLAALLGLYAALAERERRLEGAEAELVRSSRFALLHEHIACWVFAFLDRVTDLAEGPYATWAGALHDVLRQEVVLAPPPWAEAVPAHLRSTEPLADPRVAGGAAFLDGLLAPARCGFVLTRADLAVVARRAGLGLRAGERRYALEHLLGQDARATLAGLAAEARRGGARHQARIAWLGATARVHAERAAASAVLLDELAGEAEAGSVGEPAMEGAGS